VVSALMTWLQRRTVERIPCGFSHGELVWTDGGEVGVKCWPVGEGRAAWRSRMCAQGSSATLGRPVIFVSPEAQCHLWRRQGSAVPLLGSLLLAIPCVVAGWGPDLCPICHWDWGAGLSWLG
jgi:hypothetical protein